MTSPTITYELFEGNTHDSLTTMPYISAEKTYGIKRIITVADKALTRDNMLQWLKATALFFHKAGAFRLGGLCLRSERLQNAEGKRL